MADQAEPGGAEVLLAAQVWPAVLVPAGILAVLVGTGVWLTPTFPYLPVGLLLSVVVLAWSSGVTPYWPTKPGCCSDTAAG